jgi:beta-mannosidase
MMRVIDLSGVWTAGRKWDRVKVPAKVPGNIHWDLLRAGRIPDPYVADNEKQVQWIGESDWTFERAFSVTAETLQHACVLLRCEGLDTLATIILNGKRIGTTHNMFRTLEFDIRAALRVGKNRIEIRFASAAAYVKARAAARPKDRPLPHWHQPGSLDGANFIRKQQCNFGWDWGPCLVTCGIWRPIRIVAFNGARLGDVRVRQDHSCRGRVGLAVDVMTERAGRPSAMHARVRVSFGGMRLAETEVPLRHGAGTVRLELWNPRLWWPNGLGESALHDVSVELLDDAGVVLDSWERRIGLRTLRLDRHPDRWGESFQFVVNGVPFFAKGANWIPADAILARLTHKDYRRLIADAAASHMNMLRAWGGGIYEDEAFYDACDEHGICVWQDFMFACATYETYDSAFMRNVRAEIEDNVRRLRHRACLALWCGNNELEMGLVNDHWYQYPRYKNWSMSWRDYARLFDKLLPETVRRLDPERDYWPGSPHTPRPFNRSNSNDPRAGDAHLWEVWHGRKPFEWYRTCEHRFNSEFGFQSFPEPRTIRPVIPAGQRNITSALMEHHQRSQIGNAAILQYMLDWFLVPKDFESALWLSQILQGNAIKYAVEHWRRAMPRGMGTLYWQLNDCWPVASWASIDFAGRWKALHYMARRFYAPVIVSGLEDRAAGTVALHITSDRRVAETGTVRWRITDGAGRRLRQGMIRVSIPACANRHVATLKLIRELAEQGERDLLVWLELVIGGETVSSNLITFARPKHLHLQEPGIRTTVTMQADGAFRVALKARRAALWCWLELVGTDARWSDNFVHLEAGRTVVVKAHAARALPLDDFRRQLRVRSLCDTHAD